MSDPDRFIPEESRRLVETRDLMHCVRCGGPGYEWHHRRSRRVRGDHRHCACNGVLLCRSCHVWAHSHPQEAMDDGLILSQWVPEPFVVPIHNVWGWWQALCNGDANPLTDAQVRLDSTGVYVVVPVDVNPDSGVQ